VKKITFLIIIILTLSGCIDDNSGTEPSLDISPTVTKPVVTPVPIDSPNPTPVEPDYNLEKSLPFGNFSLVRGDDYYFCDMTEDKEDVTVSIYKYSKKTDKIKLFKKMDNWVCQIFFDNKDNFYFVSSNMLYRCSENNNIPVINNLRYVVYIGGEHIYYLDEDRNLNKYNIADNTILEIAYVGEYFHPYYTYVDINNSCLSSWGFYLLDVRDGSIQKVQDGYQYLSPDKKFITTEEIADERHVFTVLSLENLQTTEYVIDDFVDESIDSIQIYNNHLYIITSKFCDDISIGDHFYNNKLYVIDLESNRIVSITDIFKSSHEGIESTSFHNGKFYFYCWLSDSASAHIVEYDLRTEKTRNIDLQNCSGESWGCTEIALGYLWVFNISVNEEVHYIDKIEIE